MRDDVYPKERRSKITKPRKKINEMDGFLMANVSKEITGLPMIIWVSQKESPRQRPIIGVNRTHANRYDPFDAVTVTIENKPRQVLSKNESPLSTNDFQLVCEFIKANKKLINEYWEGMDTETMFDHIVIISWT